MYYVIARVEKGEALQVMLKTSNNEYKIRHGFHVFGLFSEAPKTRIALFKSRAAAEKRKQNFNNLGYQLEVMPQNTFVSFLNSTNLNSFKRG